MTFVGIALVRVFVPGLVAIGAELDRAAPPLVRATRDAEIEESLAAAQAIPEKAALAPTPTAKGLEFKNGDFTIKFGGYIKVDAIHDFDAIGSTDSFDPRTIPVPSGNAADDNTRIHARQTRFNVDVQGPSEVGPFRAFFEGDFFSDQNGFRIRHAYGSAGSILAGQTWSTFMDEDAMPETLDFESPIAFPLIRQAQVRWTQDLKDGDYFAVAIEDPDSDVLVEDPPTTPGHSEEPYPDVNARVRLKNSRGHIQLGLFGGVARFDSDTGSSDEAALWGLNLSAKEKTFGDDSAIVQVTYGDGVGRYRGGTTATVDTNGDADAVRTFGILGSYEHHWSEKYRSTIAYSWGEGDLPDDAPTSATEKLEYLAANFIWQFSTRAWAGIEYLYGSRDTFDDGDGDASRIQLALRFDL